ncbi:SH3 domain-containing protein [Streptomyces sp. NPDC050610]|uniref:SH3 domain-containing protein n=1 Tax=Streptomyces sp. NPDC050610 TaxID=3157097 RepID=UPI00343C7610
MSIKAHATTTVKYRSGPSTSCQALGQVDKGTTLWIWDYNSGGTWVYARIAGTNTHGWFSAQYVQS